MFQGWRVKLRAAEQALNQGRLEEARRLLEVEHLGQYRQGQRLTARLAEQMAERARRHFRDGNSSAGWRELEAAGNLAGETDVLLDLRSELVGDGLREAARLLAADQPQAAICCLEKLERRGLRPACVAAMLEAARHLESARHLARRGKFVEAGEQLVSALQKCPELSELEGVRGRYEQAAHRCRDLTEQLHRAMAAEQWSEVARLVDELLELAPEHRLAREARKRAWAEVGTRVVDSQPPGATPGGSAAQGSNGQPVAGEQTQPARFLLWVDAVGGYLVCLQSEVSLGQAVPGTRVDVPLRGDLSRRHAVIRRQGEDYVIEPLARVAVDGREVTQPTPLADGDEIELGRGVKLRFRKPHPLSATARLELLSRHRTQPTADAVLLMAESCVLGPNRQNHVVAREWSNDVVLYRQQDQLCCLAMDSVDIDGQLCDGRGEIGFQSRVAGSDFALSLETI